MPSRFAPRRTRIFIGILLVYAVGVGVLVKGPVMLAWALGGSAGAALAGAAVLASAALKPERDLQFDYLGLQTLYDRYFLHIDEQRIEMPQAFFMRVAMGLALNEIDREARAVEFYDVLSSFDFMSSTPTLFNSGTHRSQLSSCYLTTVADDLDGIYEAIKENALLSKFAGGLGNDWTNVRALGSYIKGTNGKSQGVVPFLKVVNDTAVAVNQGGKRKGAVCAYLETWHLDIEEFLELRKNTGDDRRRTHDMNTANWVPDLFMKRVMEGGDWTLFSPSSCPDLHDKFGRAFEEALTVARHRAADRPQAHHAERAPVEPARLAEQLLVPLALAQRLGHGSRDLGLRLHVEEKEQLILLGLIQDF